MTTASKTFAPTNRDQCDPREEQGKGCVDPDVDAGDAAGAPRSLHGDPRSWRKCSRTRASRQLADMVATNTMRTVGAYAVWLSLTRCPSSGSASLRATALLGQVSTCVFRLVRHLAMTVQSHGGSSTSTFGTGSSISAIRTVRLGPNALPSVPPRSAVRILIDQLTLKDVIPQ